MIERRPFVGVAGNIGVGKTTFTGIVAERMNWSPFYESVSNNPYLEDFYGNMRRWSFNLQIYFLHHRFKVHSDMSKQESGVIQDRTIYEDVEIFARNLYTMEQMDVRDWENYSDLFRVMTAFLRKPDLIIYLRASVDTLVSRIALRGREYEKAIERNYLEKLNESYDSWIRSLKDFSVLTIETDQFNIYEDGHMLKNIVDKISELLKSKELKQAVL